MCENVKQIYDFKFQSFFNNAHVRATFLLLKRFVVSACQFHLNLDLNFASGLHKYSVDISNEC